jgi:hypothetical protein
MSTPSSPPSPWKLSAPAERLRLDLERHLSTMASAARAYAVAAYAERAVVAARAASFWVDGQLPYDARLTVAMLNSYSSRLTLVVDLGEALVAMLQPCRHDSQDAGGLMTALSHLFTFLDAKTRGWLPGGDDAESLSAVAAAVGFDVDTIGSTYTSLVGAVDRAVTYRDALCMADLDSPLTAEHHRHAATPRSVEAAAFLQTTATDRFYHAAGLDGPAT